MGAAQSTTQSITTTLNEAVSNIMVENASSCKSQNSSTQAMKFSHIFIEKCQTNFSNITQDMKVENNFTCMQDMTQEGEAAQALKAKLDQELTSKLKGQTIGYSNSATTALTEIKNKVIANINFSNVANCITENNQKQSQSFGKIKIDCTGLEPPSNQLNFSNISQKMVATNIADCIQASEQISKAVAVIDQETKTKQTTENAGGIDFGSLVYIIASILIVGGIVLVVFMTSGFGDAFLEAGTKYADSQSGYT